MKRVILALVVGGAIFGTVYGFAAMLDVTTSTAASGTGSVVKCGDVTGTTFLLVGETVSNGTGGDDYVSGTATDIVHVQAVNIETTASCNDQNAYVAVKNAAGTTLATGSCTISGDGTPGSGPADDGLGWLEAATADNVPGCTALLNGTPNIGDIAFLTVTMT